MIVLTSTLNPSYSSGVVTYYKRLQDDLQRAGYAVRLVTHDNTPNLARRFLGGLSKVFWSAGWAGEILHNQLDHAAKLYFALRQIPASQVELVHAQDPIAGAMARLAYGKNVPIILTCHFQENPVAEMQAIRPLSPVVEARLVRWNRWLFSKVDQFVFVSQYAYQKSVHLLPAAHHYTIIHDTVSPAPAAPAAAPRPLRITNVGFIEERRNQIHLIRIAHELKQLTNQPIEIWLIGDGPKRAEWQRLAQTLGVGSMVQFLGRQRKPWQLLTESDLYVHLAHNENCPHAIIEAMAASVPVMAIPVGGAIELLPNPKSHLSQSPKADAVSILAVLEGKKRAQLLKEQRAFFLEQLNPDAALTKLLAVYARCKTRSAQQAVPYINTELAYS
ncbi:glycosyltransferase family 4 protein [Fibrella sp. HMF5335]|uniref:Glycosyltransferase family 4 protein n=1 Tax=Fibrella rubiginis TaxID=2817060 RepID=A0A939GIB2_9BACT|nr:glycosyltransferase family 4 protein [Fibrella rubiginis]MBO0938821.1 glycosyltransferase family 4 protein [Fibrella rubiginis]